MNNPYAYSQNQNYLYQMPQSSVQNNSSFQQQNSILTIFVNSEDEVNFYPVAAGVTVMLVSFNLNKFYLKTTGKNGVPEPLRVFSFSEESVPQQMNNESNYVTKEEMKSLSDKLDKLISSLGGES